MTAINGFALTFNPADNDYSQEIDIGGGWLKVTAEGAYSYRVDDNTPAGTDSATFTVTDSDGDAVTKAISFNIQDANTPTAGSSAAAVDDDGLTTDPAGNPASTEGDLTVQPDPDNNEATFSGTLAYSSGGDIPVTISLAGMALEANGGTATTGGTGTVGQETVTYSWNEASHTLTGTVTGGLRDGTPLFSVQITDPAAGTYQVTLLDNVLHATLDGLAGDNTENDALVTLNYSVVDSDGTPATPEGTLTITFNDDMPSAFQPDGAHVVLGVETPLPEPLEITRALNFAAVAGADGVGSVSFNLATDPQPFTDSEGKTLYLNNEPLYLHYGDDAQHLVAKTADGQVACTAELNGLADVTVTILSGTFISNTLITSVTDLRGIGGGNVPFKGLNLLIDNKDPDPDGSDDVLVSSEILPLGDDTTGTVNSNATELGVGTGNELSDGEIIRYDLVQNLSVNDKSGQESYSFSSYQETFAFRQTIHVSGSSKDADLKLRIYGVDTAQGAVAASTTLVGTTMADQLVLLVSEINLYDAAGVRLGEADKLNHVAQDGDGVILYNLGDGWSFEINSVNALGEPEAFNAVEMEAIESMVGIIDSDDSIVTSFKLGEFSYGENTDLQPVNFLLPVVGVDGDGDAVSSQIDMTVYPDTKSMEGDEYDNRLEGNSGENYLFGMDGNDILIGGEGDDVLIGGQGSDRMDGGAGNDVFVWQAVDVDGSTDTIVGFELGNDKLNLADVLDANAQVDNLEQYLDVSTEGADTVIKVYGNGIPDPMVVPMPEPDLVVVLEGGASEIDQLSDLVNQNSIIV